MIDETGQAATYIYDPVGNILQIARQTTIPQDQTSIATVDPPSGAQGTQVTLTFTGTNLAGASVPSLPAGLTFVSSSFSVSGNQDVLTLTLALDAELALGPHPLTLQSALGGATSLPFSLNVTLPPPRVDQMIPPIVTMGNLVQVEGNGFDAANPAQNQVTINGVPLPLVSVSSKTKLIAQILPGVTTGPVQLTTPQGTGVSATSLTVIPGTHPQQNQVTATLRSPFRGPNRFALSPDGARAYVLNTGFSAAGTSLSPTGTPVPGSVAIIDPQSQVLGVVSVGRNPTALALTPDGSRVLVTNAFSPSGLTVIDAVTQAVVGTVSFTTAARDVVVSPDGTLAYVAIDAPAVAIVDLQTLTETARVTTSTTSTFLAIAPDGTTVYAAGSNVFVIDAVTRQITRTISGVFVSSSIALDPVAQRLYAGTFSGGAGALRVVNLAAGTTLLNLPAPTPAVALSPDRSRLYFVGSDNALKVLSTATLTTIGTVTVGNGRPTGASGQAVRVSPDGATLWVANTTDHTVSVVDTQALVTVESVPVGFIPGAVGPLPARGELYALNSASATVSVLDTATNELLQTALERFGLARPLGLVVPADASAAYVTNSFVGTTTAFAPTTGVGLATLLLGDGHTGLHLAPALSRNELFVGASNPPGVAVLSLSTRAQQAFLPLARAPRAMALSLDERRLYVVSELGGNLGTVLRTFDTATRAQLAQVTLDATLASDHIALTPDGTRLYVLHQNQGATNPIGLVRVIDTATSTQITTITAGSVSVNFTFNRTGSRLYVLNSPASVSVIDPATNLVVATISLPGALVLNNLVFTPDSSKAYLGRGNVVVINTATNTILTTVASGGVAVAISRDGQRVFGLAGGQVKVINTSTDQVVATINVGGTGIAVTPMTFSPDGARAWVVNTLDDSISVIE